MRFRATCYRAHDPKWAFSPLSGEGARIYGGRFNPKGMPALYLALIVDGLFAEMGHDLAHRFEPLTVCSYEVDVEDIVDLRTDPVADMDCAWRYEVASGREPASWRLARQSIAAGNAGLIAPSFAPGARPDMANLVLWKWGPDLPHRVVVHDPSGRLPKDQTSWR